MTVSKAFARSTLSSIIGHRREPMTSEQHGAEVHVYHAPLDEGRLVIVHNVRHSRCQAQGDALSEQLSNGVDQADRPIVPKSSGCLSFVQ